MNTASYALMKLIAPLDVPWLLLTVAPAGLRCPKVNPVPPPVLCIRAASLRVPNMLSIVSSMGSTKHAASCPLPTPAPVHVGVFGRKWLGTSSFSMYAKAVFSNVGESLSDPPDATHLHTRHMALSGVSPFLV